MQSYVPRVFHAKEHPEHEHQAAHIEQQPLQFHESCFVCRGSSPPLIRKNAPISIANMPNISSVCGGLTIFTSSP